MRHSWTQLLTEYGDRFLLWTKEKHILELRGKLLSAAISDYLFRQVHTKEGADALWSAILPMQTRCNDQSTYELPFAAETYAWLYLVERYSRTWRALEVLVQRRCLPLGRYGVRVLDVGTGPGPSAFAIHDFYRALTAFSDATALPELNQPPAIYCIEWDNQMNHLRHNLAELVHFAVRNSGDDSVLDLCRSVPDFGTILPSMERPRAFENARRQEESYYDEIEGEWVSEPIYSAQEANEIAQSLHRYRLIVFSNFLTTVGTVRRFESNLNDLLSDTSAGTVLLVLGARGEPYPEIYEYVDKLARAGGFDLLIENQLVGSVETTISDLIYDQGKRFYDHLQTLSPNSEQSLRSLHRHFGIKQDSPRTTSVRAYRKGRR